MNAPSRVPTSTRTPLIPFSFRSVATVVAGSLPERATRSGSEAIGGGPGGRVPPRGGAAGARAPAHRRGGRAVEEIGTARERGECEPAGRGSDRSRHGRVGVPALVTAPARRARETTVGAAPASGHR